jgi:membrane protein insertase Oxa1/YidC/SpoIIIJ
MKIKQDVLMEWDKTRKKYCYSMRRICIAIAFPYALGLGLYIVISDRLLGLKTVNIYAIQVFNTIFLFVAIGLGLNLASYIKNTKEE